MKRVIQSIFFVICLYRFCFANEVLEAVKRLDARTPLVSKKSGKITFNFYGMKKCPLNEAVMNTSISAIAKADALIGVDAIPFLEIDEWCSPGAKGTNRMNLGEDGSVQEDNVIHEYGHNYLTLKLGPDVEQVLQDYLQLALLSSQKKVEALQNLCGCGPKEDTQEILFKHEEYEKMNKYILSMHEYFADMFTLIVTEKDTVFQRNYASPPLRWPWTKVNTTDTHHSLESIWKKSFNLAKSTFGDDAKKKELLEKLITIIQNDISKNLNSYKKNDFKPEDLAKRLSTKLFPM